VYPYKAEACHTYKLNTLPLDGYQVRFILSLNDFVLSVHNFNYTDFQNFRFI